MDYETIARKRIISDLRFTDSQLDFMGRFFTLQSKTDLISRITAEYSNVHSGNRPILILNEPRSYLYLMAELQPALRENNHSSLQHRIQLNLLTVGINPLSLFSYCQKSYGIEREDLGISAHFGFY